MFPRFAFFQNLQIRVLGQNFFKQNFSPASEGENERLARLQKEKAEADENFRNQIVIQNNIREFGEFKDDHFEVRPVFMTSV